MKYRPFHSILVCASVTAVALANPAPSGTPLDSIAMATPLRPTWSCNERTPRSDLQLGQAHALAANAAWAVGRDIIVCAVAPTGSMRPYFDENALLLLAAAPFEQLRVGDIVTYYHPRLRQVVVHRLVERRGDGFWSKGDHNRGMDDIYITRTNYRRLLVGIIYMDSTARASAGAAVKNDRKTIACAP